MTRIFKHFLSRKTVHLNRSVNAIHIRPKDETEFTWKWQIKDTDSCVFILLPFIKLLVIF